MAQILEEQKSDPIASGLKIRKALSDKGRFMGIPNKFAVLPLIAAFPLSVNSVPVAAFVFFSGYSFLYFIYKHDPDALTIYYQSLVKTERRFNIRTASKPKIKTV